MANLTEPSFTSGKREELADLISLIDAKDTPFTSMAKKGSKPGNTQFRWQADSLPTPKITGTVDGTDVSTYENYVKDMNGTNPLVYRAELSNYIQIFRRAVRVSPLTMDIATVAGVRDELANNVAKGIKGLKRDMEATFCSSNGAVLDNGSAAYQTRGLDKWLTVAGSGSQDSVLPIASAFQTPSANISTASTTTLTESDVQGVLTGIYNQTGQFRDFDLLCGTALKRAFTNLTYTTPSSGGAETRTAVRTLNREADASAYVASVDIFEGDFGKLRLHPSHFLKSAGSPLVGNTFVGYVIPFDQVEVRYGGNVAGVTALPNAGGGEARLIEAVAGLCVYNPKAFGVFNFTA
ncbi:hypothetical protein CCP3SC1AL1_400005 [Gammaproteobacteria bacterium]